MDESMKNLQFMLTAEATVSVTLRADSLIGIAVQKDDGECVVAELTPVEAFDLHRMVLEAAVAATKRGVEA